MTTFAVRAAYVLTGLLAGILVCFGMLVWAEMLPPKAAPRPTNQIVGRWIVSAFTKDGQPFETEPTAPLGKGRLWVFSPPSEDATPGGVTVRRGQVSMMAEPDGPVLASRKWEHDVDAQELTLRYTPDGRVVPFSVEWRGGNLRLRFKEEKADWRVTLTVGG